MALINERSIEGTGLALFAACELVAPIEINVTSAEIKDALWQKPADMDRAKLLISKRMGLRIALGERQVKLKPPAAALRAQGRAGIEAIKLLETSSQPIRGH